MDILVSHKTVSESSYHHKHFRYKFADWSVHHHHKFVSRHSIVPKSSIHLDDKFDNI